MQFVHHTLSLIDQLSQFLGVHFTIELAICFDLLVKSGDAIEDKSNAGVETAYAIADVFRHYSRNGALKSGSVRCECGQVMVGAGAVAVRLESSNVWYNLCNPSR